MRIMLLGDGSSIHTLLWLRSYVDYGFEVALFTLEPHHPASLPG